MLLYVQGGLADIWKENILEDLETRALEYATVEEFLTDLKKELEEGDNEIMKVAELKKIEEGSRIIEKFLQGFKRVAKRSRYEERLLIEEFKQEMNSVIGIKFMETEKPPRSIEW